MPRVISQEDAESSIDSMTAIVSILAILLLGAGVAIVVLLRRDGSGESIFYDDDDEWEDEPEEYSEAEPERILPPMAPSRPDMDAATKALEPLQQKDESEDETESSSEVDTSSVNEDPWADVDYTEEE